MAFYSTSEFKPGMKVLLEGAPCSIVENEFVKPGKGQAFNRVRLRNLQNGRMWERTFKSGESLEGADVMDMDMQYLYTDGEFWHFMKTDGSFEQLAAGADVLGDSKEWLKEEDSYIVTLWNDVPIAVTPPNFIILEVVGNRSGHQGRHRHRRHEAGESLHGRCRQSSPLHICWRRAEDRHAHRHVRQPRQ